MVTREEYEQWREWLRTESSIKPPDIITANYWHWNCRAIMARFLMRDKIYEPALRMMETVVEHGPEEDDHYAWALADLGCLYWRVHRDIEKAFSYLDQALEVLDKTEQNREELAFFAEGGKYLQYKLSILEQAGEVEKAKDMAHRKMEYYQDKYLDTKTNSYLYYSNLFLAELAAKHEDFLVAVEYMKKGLAASEYVKDLPGMVDSHSGNDKELYDKLVMLDHSMVIAFDV